MATQQDPYAPYAVPVAAPQPTLKERGAEANIAQSGASAASSAASAKETEALLPSKVEEAYLKNKKLKEELEAKEKGAETAGRLKAFDIGERANIVLRELARARKLVSRWSTGWGSMLRALPETDARELYSIFGPEGTISAQNMLKGMEALKSASPTGSTGLAALSNAEGAKLSNSLASLDLGRDPDSVLQTINDLERSYRRFVAATRGENPDDRNVAIKYGLVPEEDRQQGSQPPPIGGVTSEENVARDPRLSGLNTTVAKMLYEGRSAADIKTYLNSVEPGLGDRAINLEWWETQMKQPVTGMTPKPEDYINLETIRTEASAPEKAIGAVAETPAGTALLGATDFATAGLIPQLTSDPEMARAAIKGAELERPEAFLAGQMLGGVTGGLGLEGLAARYGIKLTPAALAAIQSGAYGYGTSEESGIRAIPDALTSAAMGYGGGKIGSGVATGLGTVARGVKDRGVRVLSERGVPMTIGEILGPRARGFEEKLANLPIVGSAIGARLEEGTKGFNQAAFREALQDLGAKYQDIGGKTGAAGVRAARRNVSQLYKDTLQGVTVTQDNVFQRNLQNTFNELASLPDVGDKVIRALEDKLGDMLKPGRTLTGDEVQAVLRSLIGVGRSFRNNELFESSIAPRLYAVDDELRNLVGRQHPNVLPQYDAARAAWRKVSVLGDAVKRSKARGEGRGLFTPEELEQAGVRNAETLTGKTSSVTRGYPFSDLAEAGVDVLTNRARPGTPLALPLTTAGLVGGATYFGQPGQTVNQQTGETTGTPRDPTLATMYGLGAAGLASLPYSRMGQRALTRMFLGDRGPNADILADMLYKYGRPGAGGAIGAVTGGAPTRGTPDVTGYPETPTQFLPPASDTPPDMSGLGVMPNAASEVTINGMRIPLVNGAMYDEATGDFVWPDGTRVPASELTGAR